MKKSFISLMVIMMISIFSVQSFAATTPSLAELQNSVSSLKKTVDDNKKIMKKTINDFNNKLKNTNKALKKKKKSFEAAKKNFIKIAQDQMDENNASIDRLKKDLNNTTSQIEKDKIKGAIDKLNLENADIQKTLNEDLKLYDANITSINNKIIQNNSITKAYSNTLSTQSKSIKRLEKSIKTLDNQVEDAKLYEKRSKVKSLLSTQLSKLKNLDKTILARISTYNKMKSLITK